MTTEELLNKLLEMGIKIDQRTLQRYAKENLITKPKTQSLGRGKGKISDWNEFEHYEAHATWNLIHALKITKEKISSVRELAFMAGYQVNTIMNELFDLENGKLKDMEIVLKNGKVFNPKENSSDSEEMQDFSFYMFNETIENLCDELPDIRSKFSSIKEAQMLAQYYYNAMLPENGREFVEYATEIFREYLMEK
jgi:DNA-binding transcriptional regulator YhcF (GntR family)